MTTSSTTNYPVNSTTCPSCKAIGGAHSSLSCPNRVTEPCGSPVAHSRHAFMVDDGTFHYCPGFNTEALRPVYGCPDWCVRDDHDAEHVGPGELPIHYAVSFGAVHPQSDGTKDEVIVYLGEADGAFISDPAELRRVAADMIRGAEWLEARA